MILAGLMDEPFGALDTHTKTRMHASLLEIWEKTRQTKEYLEDFREIWRILGEEFL